MKRRDRYAIPKFSVAKTSCGAYRYLFPPSPAAPTGANFQIARSEDRDRGWELSWLNDATYQLMGEPAKSPHFRLKRYAYAAMMEMVRP